MVNAHAVGGTTHLLNVFHSTAQETLSNKAEAMGSRKVQ